MLAAAGTLEHDRPMLPGSAPEGNGAVTDRVICFLLVVMSGNPVLELLSRDAQGVAFGAFAAALLVIKSSRRIRATRADLLIVGAFVALSIAHLVTFGGEVAPASASFLVRLTVALLAIRVTRDFHRDYSWVIFRLACLSLVFHVPVLLGLDVRDMLTWMRVALPPPNAGVFHIGIHNFHLPETAMRNSGMFHEPGAFGGYLLLAILFEAAHVIQRASRRRLLVLVVAVLTTMSTTGYIALGVALTVLVIAKRLATNPRGAYLRVLPAVALVGITGWLAFQRLPFLGEKIRTNLEDVRADQPWAPIDRIGNFLYDLDYIGRRPLVGWSPRPTTRSSVDPEVLELVEGQGNGLSGFAVNYGLFGLLLFTAGAFASFQRLYGNRVLAVLAVGVVAILLTGEQYLQQPLFMSLMFIPHALPATTALVRRGGATKGPARLAWRRQAAAPSRLVPAPDPPRA
jgi:hypothetical protein